MHYIEQCLEPGRILNYIDDISIKINTGCNLKQAGMIELQLTDKCNLNCFHCHFRNKGDLFFNTAWIDVVLNEVLPKAISLAGGGEPTLYPCFNETIYKLRDGKSNPQIGLITNGVFVPRGNWPELLSWLRVSLYSIIGTQYAGRDATLQKTVLDNIKKYMDMSQLNMLGVSLLYYRGNVVDCVKLSFVLYQMLMTSKRKSDTFNIQFKRAFVLSDPRNFNIDTHSENLNLIPKEEELVNAIKYKDKLCLEDSGFGEFLEQCTNYTQIEEFLMNGRKEAIAQLDPDVKTPQNFTNCYVVLENRLITPDGYVYPCPSIAENRDQKLALGHILDKNEEFIKNIKRYYECNSEWCNKRFCRHTPHNRLVQNYFDIGKSCEYSDQVLADNFF